MLRLIQIRANSCHLKRSELENERLKEGKNKKRKGSRKVFILKDRFFFVPCIPFHSPSLFRYSSLRYFPSRFLSFASNSVFQVFFTSILSLSFSFVCFELSLSFAPFHRSFSVSCSSLLCVIASMIIFSSPFSLCSCFSLNMSAKKRNKMICEGCHGPCKAEVDELCECKLCYWHHSCKDK